MDNIFKTAFELIVHPTQFYTTIVTTTLKMAFTSSIIALLLGVLIGLLISYNNFPGKKIVVIILRTLMGLPPVAVGIIVYILFSGTGPFGKLGLIYSVKLMIIAQIILITPIAAGMTETSMTPIINNMKPTLKGLNINPIKNLGLVLYEGKYQIVAVYLFSFARAISEVGAVQIVGGNILYKTRVMTTAIALNYNTGDFSTAVALGIILLLISLGVNLVAALLQFGFRSRKK